MRLNMKHTGAILPGSPDLVLTLAVCLIGPKVWQ